MKRFKIVIAIITVSLLASLPQTTSAQQAYRLTEKQMKELLARIDKGAERFRDSLSKWLDVSHFNGSKQEDRINDFIKEFTKATDHLKSRFDEDNSAAADVEEVLRRAARIDNFMARNAANSRAQDEWMSLRADLDELARAYNVSWSWEDIAPAPVSPAPVGGIAYRLSDDEVKNLLSRIESEADTFRKSLNTALDESRFNSTSMEDDINSFVKGFEEATDHLKDRFNNKQSAAADVEEVLRRAARIDAFMQHHRLTVRAQEDWSRLRASLDELAAAYGISWKWM
ncbi:MAG TPA: hypothetical protein VNN73_05220 [Blastocatellia bacterium]|nr:hypothetical protein [Blastocatellia bacterium]